MKLILPYFILLIVLLQLYLKRNSKKNDIRNKEFWDKESQSNSTRKQNIDELNYITIPDYVPSVKSINIKETNINNDILKYMNHVDELRDKKILNLSHMSNTELKLTYGAANLPALSEYDDNYTLLVQSLTRAGEWLINNGFESAGQSYLEFSIECGSDLITNYTALASYYSAHGMTDKISGLRQSAQSLDSITQQVILEKLS